MTGLTPMCASISRINPHPSAFGTRRYRLSFALGWRADKGFAAPADVTVRFTYGDGSVALALRTIPTASIPVVQGSFVQAATEFVTGASGPFMGMELQIVLFVDGERESQARQVMLEPLHVHLPVRLSRDWLHPGRGPGPDAHLSDRYRPAGGNR